MAVFTLGGGASPAPTAEKAERGQSIYAETSGESCGRFCVEGRSKPRPYGRKGGARREFRQPSREVTLTLTASNEQSRENGDRAAILLAPWGIADIFRAMFAGLWGRKDIETARGSTAAASVKRTNFR